MRGVPMFVVRIGIFVGALIGFVWLMSRSSPLLKVFNRDIPHLPLYVIFGSILVALALRYWQESRTRHG
jgi:hypothetical protein